MGRYLLSDERVSESEAFYPDQWSVGIRAWYDLDMYREQCGEPAWDWATRHETSTFAQSGVISIILPAAKPKAEGNQLFSVASR